jgi:hypothetical protein
MGGDHQVALGDLQVGHLDVRQVEAQVPPLCPVVEGDVGTVFRARVEQPGPLRVLAHRVDVSVGPDARHDLRPGPAEVVAAPDVGRPVVELIALGGEVGRPRLVRRRVDQRDPAERRQVGRGDLRPGLPAVSGVCATPSEPVQIVIESNLPGATVKIVAQIPGPPCPGDRRRPAWWWPAVQVRSGEMRPALALLVVFQRCWPEVVMTPGLSGEKTIGKVHHTLGRPRRPPEETAGYRTAADSLVAVVSGQQGL